MSFAEPAVRTSSGRALTLLYKEHAADAFRYAVHLTGRRADAEDIVQQVFLQAYRHLESGRELVSPRAWLLTAVKHRAFNLTRDRREVPVDAPVVPVESREAPGDEAAQLAEVRGMLWTLPEPQHHAFVLRHWSGLSQNEIADVLETTPSAVESLLGRARLTLLRVHDTASDACSQVRGRLLDSTELGTSDEAHLGTCRPCRQAHTRLIRAANIAGTLALVPGTHVADSIAGLVPGFSAHAATSAMAGVGTASSVGAGGGASGAAWGTTTAVTTVGKVAVVAKAAAAVAAATVAIGAIPPAHHAMSALIAGHVPGSRSGPAHAGGANHHHRRGEHAPPAQAPVVAGEGAPGAGKGRSPATHPGKDLGGGKGSGKPAGAGSGGKPAGVGGGKANGQGNGAALGSGGGNAGGNGKGVGKPSGANGAGGAKPAGAGGTGNGNGNGNGGGKPAGSGGGGNGNAGGNGKGGGKPA